MIYKKSQRQFYLLKGMKKMRVMSIVKGVVAGATVGTVCYAVSNSSRRKRNVLKKNTGKALRSVVDVLNGISDMM